MLSVGSRVLVYCGQRHEFNGRISTQQNGGRQWLHVLTREEASAVVDALPIEQGRAEERQPAEVMAREAARWERRSAVYQAAMGEAERAGLVQNLGGVVAWDALRRLGAGWCQQEQCWTFPERLPDGTMVTILRRWAVPPVWMQGKNKACWPGSRGMYLPAGWRGESGPLLLVEGATDCAFLLQYGLATCGRANNQMGGELFAQLLADWPRDREIWTVAEWDERTKEGVTSWPAIEGATRFSQVIADTLDRPVRVVLPGRCPDGKWAKDVREWGIAWSGAVECWAADEVLGSLKNHATIWPAVETVHDPAGPIVDPKEFSTRLAFAKVGLVLSSAGQDAPLALDTSPAGAGKSHSDQAMFAAAGGGLVVCPTGEGAEQVAAEIQAGTGLIAKAYPVRKKSNCRNLKAANRVMQQSGLPVLDVLCRSSCPYGTGKKGDGSCTQAGQYLGELASIKNAQVAVVTHRRAEVQSLAGLQRRHPGACSVHEQPVGVLFPASPVTADNLDRAWDALTSKSPTRWPINIDSRKWNHGDEAQEWRACRLLREAVKTLIEAGQSGASVRAVAVPVGPWSVEALHQLIGWRLWMATEGRVHWGGLLQAIVPGSVVWRCDDERWVKAERQPGDESERERVPQRLVQFPRFVVLRENLPAADCGPVVLSDATPERTADGQLLLERMLSGREEWQGRIRVITPPGRLPHKQRVTLWPVDFTRGQDGELGARAVAALLVKRGYSRAGVIAHPAIVDHIKAGQLGPIGGRMSRVETFWSGAERNCNRWSRENDGLLVGGTVRVPANAIRFHLVATGRGADAVVQPEWGPRVWRARTVSGQWRTVETRGYPRGSVWAAVADWMAVGETEQSLSRSRSRRANGIPCDVLSVCPVPGVLLADEELPDIGPHGVRILSAWEQAHPGNNDTGPMINDIGGVSFQTVSSADVVRITGLGERTVQRGLLQLEAVGLVQSVPNGERGRGLLWILKPVPVPVERVQDVPGPVLPPIFAAARGPVQVGPSALPGLLPAGRSVATAGGWSIVTLGKAGEWVQLARSDDNSGPVPDGGKIATAAGGGSLPAVEAGGP